jgi:hypothetical protein
MTAHFVLKNQQISIKNLKPEEANFFSAPRGTAGLGKPSNQADDADLSGTGDGGVK